MSSRWRRNSGPDHGTARHLGARPARGDLRCIAKRWGKLDILVHSIAFAPKADLQGGLLDCSAEGFAKAMDVSCHSFIRMARLAAPLMTDGGTMFAMSYLGANRVVQNYNVMGPVKAALEASCRYLAWSSDRVAFACTPFRPARSRRGQRLASRIRVAAERGRTEGAAGRTRRHHGCRLYLRISRDTICTSHHRRHRLCRRRSQHRVVRANNQSLED